MNILLLVILVLIGFWFLLKLLKARDSDLSNDSLISFENPLLIPAETRKIIKKEFHIKDSLLVRSEQALFLEIKKQLPQGYYVFPNMRMADILTTTKGIGYRRRVYKMLPKHIDFVIADEYFKPVLAIELNGASHNDYKQKQSDIVKKEIFKNAGLPIETIRVGERYDEVISMLFFELIQRVNKS